MQRLAVGVSGSILVALVLVGAVAAAASSAAAPGPADATPCRDVVAVRDRRGVHPGVATLLTMHLSPSVGCNHAAFNEQPLP